jgi:hypothetical protein
MKCGKTALFGCAVSIDYMNGFNVTILLLVPHPRQPFPSNSQSYIFSRCNNAKYFSHTIFFQFS